MKNILKGLIFYVLIGMGISTVSNAQGLDKEQFYAAMSSNNVEKINHQLVVLKGVSVADKDAFEGALLMKKAGMVSTAKEKLSLFKSGRKMLEKMIVKDNSNAEFRFLRMMIQENAPKVVNYRSDLTADCIVIKNSFKKLSASLQQVIQNYAKNSRVLLAKDL